MKKIYRSLQRACQIVFASVAIGTPLFGQKPVIHTPVVELVDSGFVFTEGPLWSDSLGLLFSDVRASIVYQYKPGFDTARAFITPSGNSNGLKWDSTGALLLAQHGKRRIARIANGVETGIASTYEGKKLNSPNDLTVKSDGGIFFTDPPYGIQPGQAELGFSGVFRVNPKGQLILLDSTVATPNGIVFSPEEDVLYVNCSATKNIYKWNVVNDSTFTNRQVFANVGGTAPGNADGMTVDSLGNVYSTGSGGIWVIAPNGTVLDTISIPGQLTNVAFGGVSRDTLYVTAAAKLYKVYNGVVVGWQEKVLGADQTPFSIYPNPVLNDATIPVALSKAAYVHLHVLNAQGQVVEKLVEGALGAGEHVFHWNGDNHKGLHLVRLTVGGQTYVKTCVVQ